MEQEQTIEVLSQQLYLQQTEIRQLTRELGIVKDRLKSMNTSLIAPMSEETPPPHY